MKRNDCVTKVVVILSCLATSFLFLGYDARIASAQVLYGSIVGTVTDQANAVVPKTVVTAKNTSTGLSRQVNTDDAGYYSITNLPEGTYDLSVSAAGFRPLTQKGVNVLINNVARVDLSLEVGAITESVTVAASAAQLQTAKSDVNVTLGERAIENLPLSGYRNFQSLINLVPGATPGAVSERRHRYAPARLHIQL
jgi:Carboxypeptidase regulatory-like domain